MMHNKRIPVLALQLVASCFYFEKSAAAELQPDGTYECKGEIHCRLLPESVEISELGKLLGERMAPGRNPAFIIQEKHSGQNAESREITPAAIDRMIGRRRFSLGKITLRLSSKLAVTEMFLTVNPGELLIISGFPRSLLQDEGVRERMRAPIRLVLPQFPQDLVITADFVTETQELARSPMLLPGVGPEGLRVDERGNRNGHRPT
ncbi:MAG: hypothetical protein Q9228_007406 [Teloschistes exilis]